MDQLTHGGAVRVADAGDVGVYERARSALSTCPPARCERHDDDARPGDAPAADGATQQRAAARCCDADDRRTLRGPADAGGAVR